MSVTFGESVTVRATFRDVPEGQDFWGLSRAVLYKRVGTTIAEVRIGNKPGTRIRNVDLNWTVYKIVN